MDGFLGGSAPSSAGNLNDGLNKDYPRPSRDDFSSKCGSYIKLGNHKSTEANPNVRAYDASFLAHSPIKSSMGDIITNQRTGRVMINSDKNGLHHSAGGLLDTKFGGGFQRKRGNDIQNPAKDAVTLQMAASSELGHMRNLSRADTLYKTNNKNGFDVITGAKKQGIVPKPEVHEGKRRIMPVTTDESKISYASCIWFKTRISTGNFIQRGYE